ncbi:hypothetical protein BGZ89_009030 [Linnemannia elongata]|nr:hypothetical protein BGZ89_009030 [Linnemannia elongata]
MMMCENCDKGWHCYCLDPPLDAVPTDNTPSGNSFRNGTSGNNFNNARNNSTTTNDN